MHNAAIVMHRHGGPEVLELQAVDLAPPGPGEVALRQTFVGVNFHDVYVRSGQYRTLALPGTPGIEGVGVVDQLGPDVQGVEPGDRVGYITGAYGCYARRRNLPARLAVKLPDTLTDREAAALLLKGLTVQMLVHAVHPVRAGEWVLVQAAAGGVGRLLARWAAQLGARVIGTVGSAAKVAIAQAAGCAEVIRYREEDVVERVEAITGGRGVDVAYDGVGRDSFAASLGALAPCAHLVNFGQASGAVEPVALAQLAARSTTLSRPVVFHYAAERPRLEAMSAALFAAVAAGWLHSEAPEVFALEHAAQAHRLLESGRALRPVVLQV